MPVSPRALHRRLRMLLSWMSFVVALSSAVAAEVTLGAKAEARARFDRGLELFEEGHHAAALAEFQRAYELEPAYQVLFNLGKVYAELQRPVESVDALERFLVESDGDVSLERRNDALRLLEKQRNRIASVEIVVNVPQATVMIDGADFAKVPLEHPLRLGAGTHTIGVRAPGRQLAQRRVTLAGGVKQVLSFDLEKLIAERARLHVSSRVSEVAVFVDDEVIGSTPLETSVALAPGSHTVRGERPGYETAVVNIELAADSEAKVELRPRRLDEPPPEVVGRLLLKLPATTWNLKIDGESVGVGGQREGSADLALPVGRHDLVLEVAERNVYSTEVEIRSRATLELRPELAWTPEARQSRIDGATQRRIWSWSFIGVGAAIATAGGVGYIVAHNRVERLDSDLEELGRERDTLACRSRAAEECYLPVSAEIARYRDERGDAAAVRTSAVVAGSVGLASALAGVVVMMMTPSDEEIDSSAHAAAVREPELTLGWRHIAVTHVF